MNRENDSLIEGHDYDGIQEFDNPLPDWWLYTFLGTIIFAFIYFIHYEMAGGPSQKEELTAALAQVQSLKKGGPVQSEDSLASFFNHDNEVKGGAVFAAKCAACHGPEAGGLIGPNLTDKFWLHGEGKRADIFKIVHDGVIEKGMPAWGEQISEDEVLEVSAYVYSLKGKNVPGGKPAQGTEYP